jgi:four helix bundle protein
MVQVLACPLLRPFGMANEFTELIAWQRADELEKFMLEIIKRPSISRDKEFCEQTSSAAGSAPRNIAEGFGRFAPIQFANFLRIAIGSEKETKNQILKAWQRGVITDKERDAGLLLARRAVAAATGLRRYNLSLKARANAKRIEDACARWTDEPVNHEPDEP